MILSNRFDGAPHVDRFQPETTLELCFLCGCQITDPAVMWMGESGPIYFHGRCAPSFLLRLGRDVHQLEKMETEVCLLDQR